MKTGRFLFILIIVLLTIRVENSFAQEDEIKQLKWTDLVGEFTPGVSNPNFLVVKKSTFNTFVELVKEEEKKFNAERDSLQALIKNPIVNTIDSAKPEETSSKVKPVNNSSENYYSYYVGTVSLSIILSIVAFILTYLWFKNQQVVKIQEESIQNIEADFLRYKRSTLEREKKMTREIIDLKKIINPNEE
jgi:hypothetical protein